MRVDDVAGLSACPWMQSLEGGLKTLDAHLAAATFIANHELTLADVCVAATLYPVMVGRI